MPRAWRWRRPGSASKSMIVMPRDDAGHQGAGGGAAGRRRRAARRHLRRGLCRTPARLEAEHGLTFIHPYDDPDVIAGQGTVGDGDPAPASRADRGDLRADRRRRAGGGHRRLRQVPAAGRQGDRRRAGRRRLACRPRSRPASASSLDQVGLFADGVAVRQAGAETFRLCRDAAGRGDHGRHRRDLRGGQGHLRGYPRDRRAGGRRRRSPGSRPMSSGEGPCATAR